MRFLALPLLSLLPSFALASPFPEASADGLWKRQIPAGLNPQDVYIKSATWNGNGCTPPDKSTITSTLIESADTLLELSSDRTTFTMIFGNYGVNAGADASPVVSQATKFCDVLIDINVPYGWVVTVVSNIFRGYQDFDEYCTGSITNQLFFSGLQQTVRAWFFFLHSPSSFPTPTLRKADANNLCIGDVRRFLEWSFQRLHIRLLRRYENSRCDLAAVLHPAVPQHQFHNPGKVHKGEQRWINLGLYRR
jgi:hypothetical protein